MIYLFEDTAVQDLAPLSLTRLMCDMRVGVYSLRELLQLLEYDIAVVSEREVLQHLVGEEQLEVDHARSIFLNASILPNQEILQEIFEMLEQTDDSVSIWYEDVLVAARPNFSGRYMYQYLENFSYQAEQQIQWRSKQKPVMMHRFDPVIALRPLLVSHLALRSALGGLKEYASKVLVGENVSIAQQVVFDTSEGDIILESGVSVASFSVLKGPLWVGKNSKINEHSVLKDGVSIGNTCKVGGEIEASIIYDYSNKQHHGFLGHSILGSWVNLGAGTSNSDLKNTYGIVRFQQCDETIESGKKFLGCVIGDLSKTAINTSIMTGKTVGISSSVMGIILADAPNFVMHRSDVAGDQVQWRYNSVIEVQQRMFSRRGVEQTPLHIQLLSNLHPSSSSSAS
jgi:UDP-N-acetylglucosamine diphosphorylase/glucosamine-1-phosphate N-acetyltransferase